MTNPFLWLRSKLAGGQLVELYWTPTIWKNKSLKSYSLPIDGSNNRISWVYWHVKIGKICLWPNGSVTEDLNGTSHYITSWQPVNKSDLVEFTLKNR